jgi:hypothetical protein
LVSIITVALPIQAFKIKNSGALKSALSALRGKMQLTLHFTTFKKWTFTWTSS